MIINLGIYQQAQWLPIPIQINDYVVGAKNLDGGTSGVVQFFEHSLSSSDPMSGVFGVSGYFDTPISGLAGFYNYVVELTSGNFKRGYQYYVRVTGSVDGLNPATVYTFKIANAEVYVYTSSNWMQIM